MVTECRIGQTGRNLKAIGWMERLMDRENLQMEWVMFTKDNFEMIRPMVGEFWYPQKEDTKVLGGTISNMGRVSSSGVVVANIKVDTRKVKSMVTEDTFGLTRQNIRAIGHMVLLLVMGGQYGLMAVATKDNGRITKNMEKENTLGLMVEFIKVSIDMIAEMVTES